jgi:bifunctional DNA-binding transcriptional regulator/antitoxin component of YhaV-PrlF toxin-antitoxin module
MQEVILEQTDEGELFFQLPDEIIESLGWTEGDDLEFIIGEENTFMIRKVVAQSE